MKEENEKIKFIKYWATYENVTTWHLNDGFLEWWGTFYKNKNLLTARNALSYYCRKLVKEKYLNPSKKLGTGCGGKFMFGINCQVIWMKNKQLNNN